MRLVAESSLLVATHRRGFSLVEVLVAAAITAAIGVALLGLTINSLAHWNRIHDQLSLERAAAQVLDQLERDLQAAFVRDDGKTWLMASIQPGVGSGGNWIAGAKPSDVSLDPAALDFPAARFGIGGVWLRLISSAAVRDAATGAASEPAAVSYQIIRRAPTRGGTDARYLLYRTELTPAATLANGYDLSADNYVEPAEGGDSSASLASPSWRDLMAENVIDFGVRIYGAADATAAGEGGLVCVFPTDRAHLEYAAGRTSESAASPVLRPRVVDVLLRVLTTEGAQKIAALEAGATGGDWWTLAEANSRVFVRRIAMEADAQ